MKTRRIGRTPQRSDPSLEALSESRPVTVLSRVRRHRAGSAGFKRLLRPVAVTVLALVGLFAVVYLIYFATIAVLRSDLNRANADVNQRVQAQSLELTRLQTRSADLEAKLAAAMTDLGIVRSNLQVHRAALRTHQARSNLAGGDATQALKDLNDASLALGAAGAIASPDVKLQIAAALQLTRDAESAIRDQNNADLALSRLGDQLARLTAG